MGVSPRLLESLRVRVVLLVFISLTVPSRPVWAQSLPVLAQAKAGGQYDEKASGQRYRRNGHGVRISCSAPGSLRNPERRERFGPDGVRVLPVLGSAGLQNVNDVLFLRTWTWLRRRGQSSTPEEEGSGLYANVEQRVHNHEALQFRVSCSRAKRIKSYDDLKGKRVNFN